MCIISFLFQNWSDSDFDFDLYLNANSISNFAIWVMIFTPILFSFQVRTIPILFPI